MGKKRDLANENIEILVEELVNFEVSQLGTTCPYFRDKFRPCSTYDNDCSFCKQCYGEIKKKKLKEKYIVK